MTRKDLDAIYAAIRRTNRGSCLCGHGEWCPVCDGTIDRGRKNLIEALEKEFGPKLDKD